MKRPDSIIIITCLLSLVLPTAMMAAKADGKKAKLIAKYDQNKNGVIDGEEMDALRKDFEADKEGALKGYDKNGDGTLSDEEIQAIKPGANKKKSKASGGSEKSKKEKGQGSGTSEKPNPEGGAGNAEDKGAPKEAE